MSFCSKQEIDKFEYREEGSVPGRYLLVFQNHKRVRRSRYCPYASNFCPYRSSYGAYGRNGGPPSCFKRGVCTAFGPRLESFFKVFVIDDRQCWTLFACDDNPFWGIYRCFEPPHTSINRICPVAIRVSCRQSVIKVTEASSHSICHIFKSLQARDCVIGEKAKKWGEGRYVHSRNVPTIYGGMVKQMMGGNERAESPKEHSTGQRRRIATPALWVNVVV